MANRKQTIHHSVGWVMLCLVELLQVNRRVFFLCLWSKFICKVSPCSPSTRQVKLYLIKMLCSLPNSSPPHVVPLICVPWVGSDFHAAQSVPLEKREHMGHIFTCCLVWQGCSSAAENWVRTGRERERKWPEFNRTLLSFCITVTTSTWAVQLCIFFYFLFYMYHFVKK